MSISPTHLETLQKLMDAALLRQQAISNNIANVNTPGYHRQEVVFEEQLAEVLNADPDADLSGIEPRIQATQGLPFRTDGNNVDIDREIGALNKNTVLFQLYAQMLSSKIRMMHASIRGQS